MRVLSPSGWQRSVPNLMRPLECRELLQIKDLISEAFQLRTPELHLAVRPRLNELLQHSEINQRTFDTGQRSPAVRGREPACLVKARSGNGIHP